jgi:iron complex transport system substrate-binding protein
MRIVSLLPALTELVFALERGESVVGVSHECDHPPAARSLPYLTRSTISAEAGSSAEIDEMVSAIEDALYELDEGKLAELRPDLVLTQEQCAVCAVNETLVREAAGRLPGLPHVESVNPLTLEDVFLMFRRIGDLIDRRPEAESLIAGFKLTIGEIARRRRAAGHHAKPRVLLLEWLDPPFCCGHWNPELIERAGGAEVLGRVGAPSRRLNWKQVAASQPELIIVAPCGFDLKRTEHELRAIEDRPEWRSLPAVRQGRVVLADGSDYFSRPGPRLEDSLKIAAAAIDPEACGDLGPPEGEGWLPWPAGH